MALISSSGGDARCCIEVTRDFRCDLGGIRTHGIKEARVPAPQEPKAEHVQSGGWRDPAGMDDLTGRVDHRHMQPGVVALETCRPDDGLDTARCKVDRRWPCVEG